MIQLNCRSRCVRFLATAICLAASLNAIDSLFAAPPMPTPLVIGHRGACGYRPDHTLASYQLAIDQGADFVEPDLVITKDGVLFCRHDLDLGVSTDVADKFPDRKQTVTIDGQPHKGWFAHDFTLAEIKTLKARESMASRSHEFDGQFGLVTFDEFLDFIDQQRAKTGRPLGVIPEIKLSTYHSSIGLPLEDRVVEALRRHGYPAADKPCLIQSFEISNLKKLHNEIAVPLVQLTGSPNQRPSDVLASGGATTFADMMTPAGLKEIAAYAQYVSPRKDYFELASPKDAPLKWQAFMADAKNAGLKVVPFTLRREPQYVSKQFHGDMMAEFRHWSSLGADAVFTDNPDLAVKARDESSP